MFGNNAYGGQNNGNGVNVNTSIKTLYSDYSSLTLGAWNQQLSIRLAPCTGADSNGMRQYDTNRRASTALVPEKALMLKAAIENKIMPKIHVLMDGGSLDEPVSVSIALGSADKRNVFTIELTNDENGKACAFLKIHQMVREDGTCDPQNIFTYKFGVNTLLYDYNPSTGSSREAEVQSEFMFFYDLISHVSELLPLSAHGTKYNNAISARYQNNRPSYGAPQGGGFGAAPARQPSYEAPTSSFGVNDDYGLPFN